MLKNLLVTLKNKQKNNFSIFFNFMAETFKGFSKVVNLKSDTSRHLDSLGQGILTERKVPVLLA